MQAPAPSRAAFLTLLLVACMMGGNHVAARIAFNSGLDVATAVAVRSGVTAVVAGSSTPTTSPLRTRHKVASRSEIRSWWGLKVS